MGKQLGSPGDAPDHLGSILSARKAHRPSRPETGATDGFPLGKFLWLKNWADFGDDDDDDDYDDDDDDKKTRYQSTHCHF